MIQQQPPSNAQNVYAAIMGNTMTQEQFRAAQDAEMKAKSDAAEIDKIARQTWLTLPNTQELVKDLNKIRDNYIKQARSNIGNESFSKTRELHLHTANILDKVIEFVMGGKYND